MSNVSSMFIGRSDEEKNALARLISREDEVFDLQPGEEHDHGIHVRADIPRYKLIDARQKLLIATTERKSDRNFYALLVIGVVLFVKSGLSWADLIHFFASL